MVFDFGGKEHLWIRTDKELWQKLNVITNDCRIHGYDINVVLKNLIINYVPEQKNEGSDKPSKKVA